MFKTLLPKILGFFCKDNLTKSKTISKYHMKIEKYDE